MRRLESLISSTNKYIDRAVQARENFYHGMDEAAAKAINEKQPNMGPTDAKYRFGKSLKGTQLINDNKWHMAQSRTFALAGILRGVWLLLREQQETNDLLRQLLDKEK